MRLDYFLAHTTEFSRKEARRAIAGKRVTVEGVDKPRAATTVLEETPVWLDQQRLEWQRGEHYLMLHKPLGVITATRDGHQPTVMDLLPANLVRNLHPVGRLDKDSSGLLLLTSDGQWSHRITSPSARHEKCYRVTLASPLTPQMQEQLMEGVMLKGESVATRPAEVTVTGENQCRVTVTEGRYHQVRRMLAAVGNHVQALHRERIADLVLDPDLTPGQWRKLTAAEVAAAEGQRVHRTGY